MEIQNEYLGFKKQFDDPFMLPSSSFIPRSLETALDLALFLYNVNATYKKAAERTVSHFITSLRFTDDASNDENTEWNEFFTSTLGIKSTLKNVGNEFFCYGNAFCYIHYPFVRYLHDTKEKQFFALNQLKKVAKTIKYNHKTFSYTIEFNKGGKKEFNIVDMPTNDKAGISIRTIDPRNIIIEPGFASGRHSYIFKIPNTWKRAVENNILHTIEDMPLHFLQAIGKEKHFRFNSDELFHIKNPSVSGVANEGWGVPEPILNYRLLHMLQVYYKIDESIARDYMTPFRLFSPIPAGGNEGQGIGNAIASAKWKSEMRRMIANRRADPEAIHAFPYPVQYNSYGAEGKDLTPKELIEFQSNEMLNAAGYPAELYRGTLQYQAAPIAIRTFENNFSHLYDNFDKFVKWVAKRISKFTHQDMATPTLERPSVADDIERKAILQGLYQAQAISHKKLFEQLNLGDAEKERLLRLEEDMKFMIESSRKQMEAERELAAESMDSVAIQDQMAAQAGMGGGSPGGTPMDLASDADQKAQEWLAMDEGTRRQDMANTKAMNETLYAEAKQKMEEMRRMGEAQGRQMVNEGQM